MTTPTDTADLLHPVLDDLAGLVATITPEQLDRPTPCAELDVKGLRTHVLGWLANFAAGFADPGGRAPGHGELDDPDIDADAAADMIRASAAQLGRAVRAGAGERPLWLGENAMPGDMALAMILWEYQVHGWDLARATGRTWSPAERGLLASVEFAPGMLTEDFQGEGKTFGPRVPVPDDAPPLDRLLGLSGRDPSWSGG